MKSRVLITIDEVIDDETGIWNIGEVDFGISGNLDLFLDRYREKGLNELVSTMERLIENVKKRWEKK